MLSSCREQSENDEESLEEARYDDLGYEIKGNKKPWGLYRTDPKTGKERLLSKHHNRPQAQAAKADQIGMMAPAKGEKFTVKKIESIKESPILGRGMSPEARARDVDQSDREYIEQRQFKDNWKKENPGQKWPGYTKAGFKSSHYKIDETQVNELSTNTLKSYKKKATKQYDDIVSGEEGEVHPKDFMGPGNTMDKRAKGIRMANKKLTPATENLDAGQKKAGQLGPTEKVKNNNVGKLVGESEDLNLITRLAGIKNNKNG